MLDKIVKTLYFYKLHTYYIKVSIFVDISLQYNKIQKRIDMTQKKKKKIVSFTHSRYI